MASVLSPAPRAEWHRLHANDPMSSLFQGPEWMDALCEHTGWSDASRYYGTADGGSFVLPLARRGPRTAGGVYASMPLGWGMGGVVGSLPLRDVDAAAIAADLRSLRASGIRILPNPLRAEAWQAGLGVRTIELPRYSHVLDLEGGIDRVRSERYRRTARRVSNRASQAGLDIERDTTGRLIPAYRALLQRSIDRWAARSREPLWLARMRLARQDPAGKLESLADALGDRLVTWVAFYRGEPAAADITLQGNSVFAWRAAMHEELGPQTNAAYLLQNLAIKDACDNGARYYYLGESGRSQGSAMFKEHFGGIGHAYSEIRFENLPYTRASQMARRVVKSAIRYDGS